MLNISIVLYQPRWQQLITLTEELLKIKCLNTLYLIDNSPVEGDKSLFSSTKIQYRWMQKKNLGYGKAHNIAISESVADNIPFHLVMNDDIEVKAQDIDLMHHFMEKNGVVGSLMPHVVYPNGNTQYLCKLLPTPLDVFGRRFLPKRWMKKRNERYELRTLGYDRMMNVPYLSGCFMFLRTKAVLQAGLFDERYFMYPEDIDLTRTIHRNWLTLYLPDITIVHNHAQASYHSMKMLWIHIVNMCRYFNKYGWFIDKERTLVNRLTLNQFSQ
ncbi:MAG: glycosyltransferase [Paludibacteraceae bacterium]|nr:glycosyltransferase [Paludibacteraceae bacterium]